MKSPPCFFSFPFFAFYKEVHSPDETAYGKGIYHAFFWRYAYYQFDYPCQNRPD